MSRAALPLPEQQTWDVCSGLDKVGGCLIQPWRCKNMWGTGKQQAQQSTGAQGRAALTVLMWDLHEQLRGMNRLREQHGAAQ